MENKQFKKLCVVGLGYIGLPTAATFAAYGIDVIGVDINQDAVDLINQGKIHIVEPELDSLVREVVSQGKLRAQVEPVTADAFIVAVPTPFKENHEPDLSYIEAASRSLAPFLVPGNLVILESTSPVGATEKMAEWLSKARPDLTFPQDLGEESDIMIAHCPERVLPGKVLEELISNDRIVGGMTLRSSEMACSLYKIFVKGNCITTNARTAEMCKLTENSFRDVNIAFANELSVICEKLSIDVWELIGLANHHPRVNILQPGPGVGGHCIAVDPWFIVSSDPENANLIRTAREVNEYKPKWVLEKINNEIKKYLRKNPNKSLHDIKIALYGLTFKADIDDLRESPALKIASEIYRKHPGPVILIDPNISYTNGLTNGLEITDYSDFKVASIDIHVMLVGHKTFLPLLRDLQKNEYFLNLTNK